jgi:hypothetical protein
LRNDAKYLNRVRLPLRAADFPSFLPRGPADYSSLFFFGCFT